MADEIALRRLHGHRLTQAYLELHRRSSEELFLLAGTLRDLATMEAERALLDEWLTELVRVAPDNAFLLIQPTVGGSYVEREMESINPVLRNADAVVSAVSGLGLRRRSGEVLLHALVKTEVKVRQR